MQTLEQDVKEYRKLHPDCKYCAHAKFFSLSARGIPGGYDWWECKCSEKVIKFFKKAIVCRYYKVH